jgi:large subunit ribosomal protein L14
MIQKNSILKPSDTSGVIKVRVFHLYKGSRGRLAFSGDFLKVSAREVLPENPIKKKSKHKSIITRTTFRNFRKDGSFVSFRYNGLVLLKKRLTPKAKTVRGPVSRNIRRRKFLSSFVRSI